MKALKAYKGKFKYIWFPRRTGDDDIGIKMDSVKMIKPDPNNKDFSIVYYNERNLRAFEPAESVARTLWGNGKYKKQKGAYVPK